MASIYKITNLVNNKIYIGQTVNSIDKRLGKHLSQINCKNVCSALYSAFAKYGKDNFFIESIITGEYSKDELNELEIFYIKKLNSLAPNGYNLQSGGNSFMVVESVKKQISNTLKCRKITWNKKIGEGVKKLWENTEYREKQILQRHKKRGKYREGIQKPLRINLNVELINKMYANGDTVYKIAKYFNVSFYTIKKRIRNENR